MLRLELEQEGLPAEYTGEGRCLAGGGGGARLEQRVKGRRFGVCAGHCALNRAPAHGRGHAVLCIVHQPPNFLPCALRLFPTPSAVLDIQVKGLLGGHSGINIQEDRGDPAGGLAGRRGRRAPTAGGQLRGPEGVWRGRAAAASRQWFSQSNAFATGAGHLNLARRASVQAGNTQSCRLKYSRLNCLLRAATNTAIAGMLT